ncbi:MAG: hypothetical protein KF822_04245 [Steroidobacteraceae bacterium]|nr:hypothetical protein [Steroidobacteraceae bacterium]
MHTGMNEWSARLAALPQFAPPAAGWQAVLAARRRRDGAFAARLPLALAAAVLAVAVGLGWWLQSAQRELALASGIPAALPVSAAVRAENERLEWLLASLPEPRAMRGSTAFTLAEIEDRLAFVDDRLSRVMLEPNAPERAEQLWRERVGLMNSLVQVRYTDAAITY